MIITIETRPSGETLVIRFLFLSTLLLALITLGCEEQGSPSSGVAKTQTSEAPTANEQIEYIDGVFLNVDGWGPRETKRGQGFNVQPGDRYAFWITTANRKSGDKFVVTLDGKPLRTNAPPPPAKAITASISAIDAAAIINFKGIYPLAIIDLDTKVRQQIGEFVVD